jgi:hypothetical protein
MKKRKKMYNLVTVVFQSSSDTEDILRGLVDKIAKQGVVSVAEYYDLVGMQSLYMDNQWGWRDLNTVITLQIKDGFVLKLPSPILLTQEVDHGVDISEWPPIHNKYPAIWDLVIMDINKRDAFGVKKYGFRLQPFNGRDPLWDAYQEALDLVAYLRQAIFEKENKND